MAAFTDKARRAQLTLSQSRLAVAVGGTGGDVPRADPQPRIVSYRRYSRASLRSASSSSRAFSRSGSSR